MPKYTTDEIVQSVRRRASIPTSASIMTDEDIVDIANEELQNYLVPQIMSAREDYFVTYKDYVVDEYITDRGIQIPIPYDAVGSKLRDVCLIDGKDLNYIPRIAIEDMYKLNAMDAGYYIEDSLVRIHPESLTISQMRFYYMYRANELVLQSRGAQVREIRDENRVVLSRTPTHFAIGEPVDFIGSRQPFYKRPTKILEDINGTIVTLNDNTNITVGDWITIEGESVVPQIPVEAHRVLAQMTVVKALEAMGDFQGMQIAQDQLVRSLDSLFIYINPRVDSAPMKVSANDTLSSYNVTNNYY